MSSKSEKQRRKELLLNVKNKQKEDFKNSLPMSRDNFQSLFDYLDQEMSKCDDSFTLTKRFLSEKNLPKEEVLNWLNEKGAYCDCEVLANVEEQFE